MKTPRKMRIIAYYRVSSESQRDNTSLENQREQIHSYAKKHDLHVAAEFEDVASAKDTKRSGFQKAMSYLEKKKIDAFVVFKYDRAHRSLKETLIFIDQLKEMGVGYISVTQNIDTTTPQGRLFFQMVCSFAEFERETIKERCRDGRKTKLAKKEAPGGRIPFGYDSKWKIIPAQAEMLKKIFNGYLKLKSLSKLEKYAIQESFSMDMDVKFSRPGLNMLLKNRVYLGEFSYNGTREKHGVLWKTHHEPIIAPSIFGKVQKALERNRRR